MTVQVNIAEAKAKLSELVAPAEAGEEVIIPQAFAENASVVSRAPWFEAYGLSLVW